MERKKIVFITFWMLLVITRPYWNKFSLIFSKITDSYMVNHTGFVYFLKTEYMYTILIDYEFFWEFDDY